MLQGQARYRFRVDIDRYNPVSVRPPFTLEVNGARVSTNNDGIISLVLDPASRFISVQSLDARYRILYPAGGQVLIPASSQDIPNIVIGKPSPRQTTQEAIGILKQLDSIRQYLQAERRDKLDTLLLARQDSILAEAHKRYALTDRDLRTAREVMEGRDLNFREISGAFSHYLNQAKNLRDAFANIASFAFSNPKALRLLDSTITLYSATYDTIYNQHAAWEQHLRDFWFSTELALGFHNLSDFALNDLHREYFLMLNVDVIKKINTYFNETSARKKRSLKEEVISHIKGVLPHLDNRLGILDTKTGAFLGNLQSLTGDYQGITPPNQVP